MTRLVEELAARGNRLHVVTSLPWYRDHAVEDGWGGRLLRRETTEWGRISRLHPFASKNKSNLVMRAAAFGVFTSASLLTAAFTRRTDVVLAMSPPLTLGPAAWLVALRMRAPMVFNIQDVYPDAAVQVGAISNSKVIWALRKLERFSYARSSAVTVLSDDLRDSLADRVAEPGKVRVIPNFVDTTAITPARRDNTYRDEFGIGDETVVMYAGNVGFSQPLELVVAAARRLADRSDIRFVVNGEGSRRAELEREVDGLGNVTIVDFQPKDRLAEVLAAGDVHLVLLREGLASVSVPSKMYSILAAGRPVLASVDQGTEVDRVLSRSGAGTAVPAGDTESFIEAVVRYADDAPRRQTEGRAGRAFAETWLSAASVAEAYEDLFAELVASRKNRRSKAGPV
ncbi:MAG: glycosyltransferase family 4 protein [Actinomycetota bacterium]|nr:glycosyltransferase family 4 protein [Actinomycetota bacterium]